MIGIILGVGIIAAIFVFLAFNFDEKHVYLRFLFLCIAFAFLMIIPKAAMDDVCVRELASTNTSNNITDYQYSTVCYDSLEGTSETTFYKAYLRFIQIMASMLVVYAMVVLYKNRKKLQAQLKMRLGK